MQHPKNKLLILLTFLVLAFTINFVVACWLAKSSPLPDVSGSLDKVSWYVRGLFTPTRSDTEGTLPIYNYWSKPILMAEPGKRFVWSILETNLWYKVRFDKDNNRIVTMGPNSHYSGTESASMAEFVLADTGKFSGTIVWKLVSTNQ